MNYGRDFLNWDRVYRIFQDKQDFFNKDKIDRIFQDEQFFFCVT